MLTHCFHQNKGWKEITSIIGITHPNKIFQIMGHTCTYISCNVVCPTKIHLLHMLANCKLTAVVKHLHQAITVIKDTDVISSMFNLGNKGVLKNTWQRGV